MSEQAKKTGYLKKLAITLCVNAFSVFTVLFFSPLEIFFGNSNEFTFSVTNAAVIMLLICLGITVVTALIEALFPEKVLNILNALCFSGGLCAYVQSLLLNGSMATLTGEGDNYSDALIWGNIAVWAFIVIAVITAAVIFTVKGKGKTVRGVLVFVSCAVIVMQLTGFVSVFINKEEDNGVKGNYISADGQFELSKNKNVVYFVIDTCDHSIVEDAIKKYPDIFKNLNGFTYFPDAISNYSRTYPSVPYLLTKTDCRFDKPYGEYINEAYKKGHFINDMHDLGADVRLYTQEGYVSPEMAGTVDNLKKYDSKSFASISVKGLLKESIRVSCYRVLPYAAKYKFRYVADTVNASVKQSLSERGIIEDDLNFYNTVKEEKISVNEDYKSAFRFYHFWGVHPGYEIDENVNANPKEFHDAFAGCMKIIDEYIAQMKQLGVYDNSTIIITADHGSSNPSDDLTLSHASACLMLVKPAGADSEKPIVTSKAPVCHEDLFGTCLSSLGGKNFKDYNAGIFSIKEDEKRKRTYNHTALLSDDDGEIALIEYSVEGDARELASYKATGKVWDVNYSERAVSKHRFSEFKK